MRKSQMQNQIVYDDGRGLNEVLGNRSLAAGDNVGSAQIDLALIRLQVIVKKNEALSLQKKRELKLRNSNI